MCKSVSENVVAAILAAGEGGILPPVSPKTRGWKPLSLAGWEARLHIFNHVFVVSKHLFHDI
jgi:hypothetical protein